MKKILTVHMQVLNNHLMKMQVRMLIWLHWEQDHLYQTRTLTLHSWQLLGCLHVALKLIIRSDQVQNKLLKLLSQQPMHSKLSLQGNSNFAPVANSINLFKFVHKDDWLFEIQSNRFVRENSGYQWNCTLFKAAMANNTSVKQWHHHGEFLRDHGGIRGLVPQSSKVGKHCKRKMTWN